MNSDRNLTIKSVKVNGSFASVGTYNIDQLEYTTAPSTASVQYDLLGTGTYSYTKTNGVAQIKGTASDNYYFMLLPSATPDATIEVTYSFEGEESVTYKVTTPYTGAFAAGKSYQFKLNMVSKQIQFAVGIAPWYEEGENATNTETVVDLSAGSTVTVVTNSNTNNNTENA